MTEELTLRRILEVPYDLTYICCRKLKDEILAGSTIGTLMIFSRTKNDERGYNSKAYVRGIDEKKQPILKMCISEEYKVLVILYENQIVVRDLDDCNSDILCRLSKFKKVCSMDCYYDNEKGKLYMAVCDDKTIKLYSWTGDNFKVVDVNLKPKEFLETPTTIQWLGKTGLLGFIVKRDFYLLNIWSNDSGDKQCICIRKDVKTKEAPQIIYLDDFNLIGCVQGASIYFTSTIDITSTSFKEMKFSEEISYCCYQMPYIMAVTRSGKFEIRCRQSCEIIQSKATQTRITFICPNGPGISICGSGKYIYELDGKRNAMKTIERHKVSKNYELAAKLGEVYGITEEEKLEIRRAQAFEYFRLKDFKSCMKVVRNMNLEVLPLLQMFIRYLPYNDYPYELNGNGEADENLKESLDEEDLKKLLIELIDYLVDLRHRYLNIVLAYENYSGKHVEDEYELAKRYLVIVDTSVVQCYLHLDSIMVKSFLRSRNFCNFECIEDLLKDLEKYDLLYLHYKNAGMHHDALAVLQHLYNKDGSDFSDLNCMVEYLKEIGHKNLDIILEYAIWVFNIDERKGMEIFIDNSNEYEEVKLFDRVKVNDFLSEYDSRLAIEYLEFIIDVWKDNTIDFSEYLATLYRIRIDKLRKDYVHACKDDDKYIKAGEEEGELGILRKKFLKFLDKNDLYAPRKMLDDLEGDYFYEERAIVYRRMKKHKEALCIYMSLLKLYDVADSYCETYYDPNDPYDREVFNLLFEGYMKPFSLSIIDMLSIEGIRGDVNVLRALDVLEKHASRMNITKAMSMIPDDIDIDKLENVFKSVITSKMKQCDDAILISSITKSTYTQCKEELKKRKTLHFKIGTGTRCSSCNKGIRDSAFVVHEDGGIYDYGCYTKLSCSLE
uniref:CNH domain-containing protein n=1 Tax=Parastrongyloides trichosuri TaxID=131310 RepID=A0A0N4ZLW3_PARTI